MNKFSEFKSNLTSSQKDIGATAFSTLSTSIVDYLLIFFFQDNLTKSHSLITLCMLTMVLSNFLFYSIFYCLFTLSEKEAKKLVFSKFGLTETEYTEVKYDSIEATKNTSRINFLLIAHTKHYFYAKLNENGEIALLIKNSKQDIIYDSTVSFSYFYRNFETLD